MSGRRVGSAERALRVAIVGSGPAGFYAAEALLSQQDHTVTVDVFDRLPTPYGLVRGGVAPDHQSIKSVAKVFERTAKRAAFRFFGNIELGRDVSVAELMSHYDQLIYAVGNEGDRRLGIPGEGIPRSVPAAVFVGWYNGHPDYREARIDVRCKRVAIVGNGNVAIDVARVLAKQADELEPSDIAEHALEALAASEVEEIHILGRRGPVQAAFAPAELKELNRLKHAVPYVEPLALDLDPESRSQLESAPKQTRRNMELLRDFSHNQPATGKRSIHFHFLVSPLEVFTAADGGVGGLQLQHNQLRARNDGTLEAVPTSQRSRLEVDVVVTAVGFAGTPLSGVPFDSSRRVIANRDGRVCKSEELVANQYVVGWARSGPRGLIGTHKKASAEVVSAMLSDVDRGLVLERDLPCPDALITAISNRGTDIVSFSDWQILDGVETARGEHRGAPRVKVTRVDEMLASIAEHKDNAG